MHLNRYTIGHSGGSRHKEYPMTGRLVRSVAIMAMLMMIVAGLVTPAAAAPLYQVDGADIEGTEVPTTVPTQVPTQEATEIATEASTEAATEAPI